MSKKICCSLFLLFFLTSCADLKKQVGLEKNIPDEFLIEKNEPLSLPPDYKILPPGAKDKNSKINKVNDIERILDKKLEQKKSPVSSDFEKEILEKIR